jgi:hypothetical protein
VDTLAIEANLAAILPSVVESRKWKMIPLSRHDILLLHPSQKKEKKKKKRGGQARRGEEITRESLRQ